MSPARHASLVDRPEPRPVNKRPELARRRTTARASVAHWPDSILGSEGAAERWRLHRFVGAWSPSLG